MAETRLALRIVQAGLTMNPVHYANLHALF
jgi:hypothetical protein